MLSQTFDHHSFLVSCQHRDGDRGLGVPRGLPWPPGVPGIWAPLGAPLLPPGASPGAPPGAPLGSSGGFPCGPLGAPLGPPAIPWGPPGVPLVVLVRGLEAWSFARSMKL